MSCYLGLLGLLGGIFVMNTQGPIWNAERTVESLFLVATAALPQLLVEAYRMFFFDEAVAVRGADNVTSGSGSGGFFAALSTSVPSVCCRSLGLATTLLCMASFYWLFDEYHHSFVFGVFDVDERPPPGRGGVRNSDDRPYYFNFFRIGGLVLRRTGGWGGLSALLFAYVLFTDIVLASPKDGYYHTGRLLVSPLALLTSTINQEQEQLQQQQQQQQQEQHIEALKQHVLECLVRCFYAPIMFCALCDNLPVLHIKQFLCQSRDDGRYAMRTIILSPFITHS
jgi:hypothetical protein